MLLVGGISVARADAYPERPIRLIVPYGPGGASDIFARVIGKSLSERLKQSVIVENRPGAGGSIGAAYVARAKPDGYMMMLADESIYTISPELYPNLPYKTTDLAPVINVAIAPQLLVTAAQSPIKSFQDVLSREKSQPGHLNVAVSGTGTVTHLATVLLNQMAHMRLRHVPYKGGGPALSDVVGGQVDLMLLATPAAMPLLNNGQLRALAVTTSKRVDGLENVPTMAEAGVPGYEALAGQGIFFPAGTPSAIVDRINREIDQILRQPEIKKRWSDLGAEYVPNNPGQDQAWLQQQAAKWGKLIQMSNIHVE
jgi:tripartite-type tricarboxylate transporter receptor subunit TctC